MILELFKTQSGVKQKTREPVLAYLDEMLNKGYTCFAELSIYDKNHTFALLLISLDRYCQSDWLLENGASGTINMVMSVYFQKITYCDKVTSCDLLSDLSEHVIKYYTPYLDKYMQDKSGKERLKKLVAKQREIKQVSEE